MNCSEQFIVRGVWSFQIQILELAGARGFEVG
jgi:hypothetical protein